MKNIIFLLALSVGFSLSDSVMAQSAAQQTQQTPAGYKSRVDMYDDVTSYFIMPNDEVMQAQGDKFVLVGYKEPRPAGRTELLFIFTILQPPVTYGVDKYGHVWQTSDGGFRHIVGNANRAGLIENMYAK